MKNIWIFKLQTRNKNNKEKYNHYHNIKANIYEMYASDKYFKKMHRWRNNKLQRYIMMNEICINEFKWFSLIN